MFGRQQSKKPSKELLPNFYYFAEGSMLDCNVYAIRRENGKIALIDTGNGLSFSALEHSFEDIGWKIDQIDTLIITHDHLDHIMGIYKIYEQLINQPPKIYAHPYTVAMIKRGNEKEIVPPNFGVSAKRFNINVIPIDNVQALSEEESLKVGDFEFNIIFTPGHSKGSICLYDPLKKLLITGDVIFPNGSFGRYDFPGCSLHDLKTSISHLNDLDVEMLCAGHMAPVQKNANYHIKQTKQNILMM